MVLYLLLSGTAVQLSSSDMRSPDLKKWHSCFRILSYMELARAYSWVTVESAESRPVAVSLERLCSIFSLDVQAP